MPTILGIKLDYREPYQYLIIWGIVTLILMLFASFWASAAIAVAGAILVSMLLVFFL